MSSIKYLTEHIYTKVVKKLQAIMGLTLLFILYNTMLAGNLVENEQTITSNLLISCSLLIISFITFVVALIEINTLKEEQVKVDKRGSNNSELRGIAVEYHTTTRKDNSKTFVNVVTVLYFLTFILLAGMIIQLIH